MNANLEWIIKCFSGHTEGVFQERFKSIIIPERTGVKIGCCLGFIVGLRQSNEELAEYFADNFIRVFEHPYIGKPNIIEHDGRQIPSSICRLYDDGSALSFSFITYRHITEDEINSIPNAKSIVEYFGYKRDKYIMSLNGGIIFHGMQKQFSVTLDNTIRWQIHT